MKLIPRDYKWHCRRCEEDLEKGESAVVCEDAAACPYSADWGGDACGYVVCRHCHRPAAEVPV